MKSSQCRTRWHDRCTGVIEHDDGSADVCECDCGHTGLNKVNEGGIGASIENADVPQVRFGAPESEPYSPPPHPEAFDHNVYRVAEEQPGVDSYQPWVLDFCLECHMPTWTHDHMRAEKHEILCETCSYMLISELSETKAKRQNTPTVKYHDPFAR